MYIAEDSGTVIAEGRSGSSLEERSRESLVEEESSREALEAERQRIRQVSRGQGHQCTI